MFDCPVVPYRKLAENSAYAVRSLRYFSPRSSREPYFRQNTLRIRRERQV